MADRPYGREVEAVDLSRVTVQDCIEMNLYKDMSAILNDGAVLGFRGGAVQEMTERGAYNGIQNMPVLRGKP